MLWAGWDEIIRLKEQLEGRQSALSGSKYMVLPLHSMVPAADQRKVFKRPPVGVRKIVLATNIAETVGPCSLFLSSTLSGFSTVHVAWRQASDMLILALVCAVRVHRRFPRKHVAVSGACDTHEECLGFVCSAGGDD